MCSFLVITPLMFQSSNKYSYIMFSLSSFRSEVCTCGPQVKCGQLPSTVRPLKQFLIDLCKALVLPLTATCTILFQIIVKTFKRSYPRGTLDKMNSIKQSFTSFLGLLCCKWPLDNWLSTSRYIMNFTVAHIDSTHNKSIAQLSQNQNSPRYLTDGFPVSEVTF